MKSEETRNSRRPLQHGEHLMEDEDGEGEEKVKECT